ncbi:cellulase family glycosylhydrolase [Mediterraneibacter gnavus]|uniref:cellulase family glycosylhydrolase n=1 Tax=Mediterraneibacter gnavus TaxID=33038 RepID=UPI0022854867|nr:cellulase family glycosylhydrolase [Mediterraneibacter gnavus]MCZ0657061.1 cellulase family glycosylhydrolase [Mediterraneibacter gnavus]
MKNRLRSMFIAAVLVGTVVAGSFTAPFSVQAAKKDTTSFEDLNQSQIVEAMGPGWNLGNQLESVTDNVPEETNWGNPVITEKLIQSVKAAGFKSIRIPVSYFAKIDDDKDYTIDSKWLDRVQEVVDYCIKNDLYAVINIHGDGYNTIDGSWLLCNGKNQTEIKKKYKKVWKQIAERFKNYDEHLLFESMNEEFDGSYSEPNKEYYQNINDYNQIFVDTVRKTGDNNTKRWLIIPGWNTNIDYTAGDYGFKLPTDQYRDKSIDKEEQRIMISVHYYSPWDFCGGENCVITQWGNEADDPSKTSTTCDETYMKNQLNLMKTTFADKGYPVFIGEYGSIGKTSYDSENEYYRAYFARKLCQLSRKNGCIPMYWDNGYNGVHGFGLFDRTTCEVTQPVIIDAIMEGFGQKASQNSTLMSVRLYVSDSKYWTTIQSDNTARITKKGGTYTLKLKGDKDMLLNITTIALKDCDVELGNQTKSDFTNAQIVIDKVLFNGTDYTVKENKNDEVFSEKGSLQMDLINQWSEAEPMIEGLQKKESFSFQDADYKDENVLEVTFTISNLK